MKKCYHICLSAGKELLCRTEEDYIYCFNALALAIKETDSELLADSVMSTHIHYCVITSEPLALARRHKYKYTRHFNNKYHRKGSLMEQEPFIIELEGMHHILTAICYVLRNPLHHGVSPTPFGYRHCSASSIFLKELGTSINKRQISRSLQHNHLPYRVKCPKEYRMDSRGLIFREDVVSGTYLEHLFGTPRSYLYYMNRISSEEWLKEQEKDNSDAPPITLKMIEYGIKNQTLAQMLSHEHGRSDYRMLTDMQLCEMIDEKLISHIGKESVYSLSSSDKKHIANLLSENFRISDAQIMRCLAIGDSDCEPR